MLFIGGVIGASLMGMYVHHRLNALIEPARAENSLVDKVKADDLIIQTLRDRFRMNESQVGKIRLELTAESTLRDLAYLEAVPILNRPKYTTFHMIEQELSGERLADFLGYVAESLSKKRPKPIGELYRRLLLTASQYPVFETAYAAEIRKGDLPADNTDKAAWELITRTKDQVFAILSPEQQQRYTEYLAQAPSH